MLAMAHDRVVVGIVEYIAHDGVMIVTDRKINPSGTCAEFRLLAVLLGRSEDSVSAVGDECSHTKNQNNVPTAVGKSPQRGSTNALSKRS